MSLIINPYAFAASGPITFSDDFNRANGALGSNWTAASIDPDLSLYIANNEVEIANGGGTGFSVYLSPAASTNRHYVRGEFWNNGSSARFGLVFASNDAATDYLMLVPYVFDEGTASWTTVYLLKITGGVLGVVDTTTGTGWSRAGPWRVWITDDGIQVTCSINNVFTDVPVPSSHVGNTRVGMVAWGEGAAAASGKASDNFFGGDGTPP